MNRIKYHIKTKNSPIWAFALHDGHQIEEQLLPYLLLNDEGRLREEDPYTALFADLPVNQFIVGTSRFQLDLNRSIENSIYLLPEQAWGLNVWSHNLPESWINSLHSAYQEIYDLIEKQIQHTIDQHGYFIVLDIHSYNAKRISSDEVIDTSKNPQINLGTYYNAPKWDKHITDYIKFISSQKIGANSIDIRENIKFKGGFLAQFIASKYGEKGYVLSIEFRKDFMDEWTGAPYLPLISQYKKLLINSLSIL